MTEVRRETARLAELAALVTPALQRFLDGEHADHATIDAGWRSLLDQPLPEQGLGADEVMRILADQVVPFGSPMADPGFLGFITAPGATVSTVASMAQSVMANQRYFHHSGNLLEALTLGWIADLCGLPEHRDGVFSSDGTAATIVALGAARQHAYEAVGHDVAADGPPRGGPEPVLYASEEAHHCVLKTAAILGVGRSRVRLVATDERLRMQPAALAATLVADRALGLLPVAVVATVGTTSTGSIDPVADIAEICSEHGTWLHVDGAYGLPAILDERVAPAFDAVRRADSVVVDAHKWLCTPIGAGATLVRDVSVLERSFTGEPSGYLQDPELADRSFFGDLGTRYDERGLELSAPARGVMVWAALLEVGRSGLASHVRTDIDRARRTADLVRAHPEMELLLEPELSVVCFRYTGTGLPADRLDGLNAAVLERLRSSTPYAPSLTRVRGVFAIRPVFLNPRTRDEDVPGLIDEVVRLGRELAASVVDGPRPR